MTRMLIVAGTLAAVIAFVALKRVERMSQLRVKQNGEWTIVDLRKYEAIDATGDGRAVLIAKDGTRFVTDEPYYTVLFRTSLTTCYDFS